MKQENCLFVSIKNNSYGLGSLIERTQKYELYSDTTGRFFIKVFILKSYYEKTAFTKKSSYLLKKELPVYFIKPIDIIETENFYAYVFEKTNNNLQYLSDINSEKPSNENFLKWYNSTGGLEARLKICVNLGFVFKSLETVGLHFNSLSANEIFLDDEKNIFIFAIENLSSEYYLDTNLFTSSSDITPETPPELANNFAKPDLYSDSYIYTVLVFNLLTFTYPYYETVEEYQKYLKGKYASSLFYVKELGMKSHKEKYNDTYLNQWLHWCFSKTFKYGQVDRCARKYVSELLKACIISYNLAYKCPICNDWGYRFDNDKCPNCKQIVSSHIKRLEFQLKPFVSELGDSGIRSKVEEIEKLIRPDGNPYFSIPIILSKEKIPVYRFYYTNSGNPFEENFRIELKQNKWSLIGIKEKTVMVKNIDESDFFTLDCDDVFRGKISTTFVIK